MKWGGGTNNTKTSSTVSIKDKKTEKDKQTDIKNDIDNERIECIFVKVYEKLEKKLQIMSKAIDNMSAIIHSMSGAIYIHLTEFDSQESKQRAAIIKRLKKIESDTEIILETLKNNEVVTRVELPQKLPEKIIKLQKLEELLESKGIDLDDVIQVLENKIETPKDETTNNSEISNKIEINNNDKEVENEDIEEPKVTINGGCIPNRKDGNYIYFLANNVDLTGRKPTSIIIYHKTIKIKHLREILIEIVKYALEIDKEKLIQMAVNEWTTEKSGRPILTSKKFHISQEQKAETILVNKIYLDTSWSGNDIWRISKSFLKEFHIPEDRVMVHIKEYDNSIYF